MVAFVATNSVRRCRDRDQRRNRIAAELSSAIAAKKLRNESQRFEPSEADELAARKRRVESDSSACLIYQQHQPCILPLTAERVVPPEGDTLPAFVRARIERMAEKRTEKRARRLEREGREATGRAGYP